MTPGRTARPTLFTNSETKVRAFNATTYYFLASWLQQLPTWKQYRCQILLFTAHPGMGGENLSLYAPYRALFCHRSPSRKDATRTVPHDLGDSALSTRPRLVLDLPSVSREKRLTWHNTRGLFTVSSSTSPWCPGMAGYSRGTSLQPPLQRSTKLHFKGTPASLPPLTL
jgi:hypothetical protein